MTIFWNIILQNKNDTLVLKFYPPDHFPTPPSVNDWRQIVVGLVASMSFYRCSQPYLHFCLYMIQCSYLVWVFLKSSAFRWHRLLSPSGWLNLEARCFTNTLCVSYYLQANRFCPLVLLQIVKCKSFKTSIFAVCLY